MLSYETQYNIAFGIFLTFDKKFKKPKLHVNHKPEIMTKYQVVFPYLKYDSTSRSLFISTCLFIMFKRTPTSFYEMMAKLKEVDKKDVKSFLYEIKTYQQNIQLDINYLIENYQNNISSNEIFFEYQKKKIHFYTVWFYLKSLEKHDPTRVQDISNSRVHSMIYNKLQFIMLFLKFKPESIKKIELMYDIIEL